MAAAPATKGFTSPISIQGSSTGKVPDFDTYAQFKPMAEVTPVAEGPKTFKFPLDDVSAGNFWTRLIVNSWVPTRPKSELVDQFLVALPRIFVGRGDNSLAHHDAEKEVMFSPGRIVDILAPGKR